MHSQCTERTSSSERRVRRERCRRRGVRCKQARRRRLGRRSRPAAPTLKSVLELGDVQADYDRAGEVLSCLADAANAGGSGDAIRTVEAVLDRRLATELAMLGTFVAAGRE